MGKFAAISLFFTQFDAELAPTRSRIGFGSIFAPKYRTTSNRASRCRTPSSNHSTASCATSALTSTCSPAWEKRALSSRRGGTTTITLRPHSSLGYLTPEEFAARNQGSSAIARTAWPAELAGAVQRAPPRIQNQTVFQPPALRE